MVRPARSFAVRLLPAAVEPSTVTDEATGSFDDAILVATAADHDVDRGELAELVGRHQSAAATLPGIEDLVYEWRKQYDDAVVERTPGWYYLCVPEWVWGEFADHLDAGERDLAALVEVHRRTVVARTGANTDPPDGRTYVAFDRGRDGD